MWGKRETLLRRGTSSQKLGLDLQRQALKLDYGGDFRAVLGFPNGLQSPQSCGRSACPPSTPCAFSLRSSTRLQK